MDQRQRIANGRQNEYSATRRESESFAAPREQQNVSWMVALDRRSIMKENRSLLCARGATHRLMNRQNDTFCKGNYWTSNSNPAASPPQNGTTPNKSWRVQLARSIFRSSARVLYLSVRVIVWPSASCGLSQALAILQTWSLHCFTPWTTMTLDYLKKIIA